MIVIPACVCRDAGQGALAWQKARHFGQIHAKEFIGGGASLSVKQKFVLLGLFMDLGGWRQGHLGNIELLIQFTMVAMPVTLVMSLMTLSNNRFI